MEAGDQSKVAEIGNKPAYGTFGEPTKESPHDENKLDPEQDQSLRHRIFQFVHHPHSSTAAYWYAVFNLFITVVATAILLIQSEPGYFFKRELTIWDAIGLGAIVFYTIDYILNLATAPSGLWFAFKGFMITDFLATFPFYVELILDYFNIMEAGGAGLATLRALRLLRLFRIFSLFRYSALAKVFVISVKKSRDGLILLFMVFFMVLIVFSTLIFYAEQTVQTFDTARGLWIRPDGSVSPFQSIVSAMWWCMVTMTTVGYGDTYPISPLGKVVAGFTAMSAIMVLALPLSLISTQFSETYSEMKKEEKDAKLFKENEDIIHNTDWEELLRVIETRFSEHEEALEKAKTAVETMEGAHKEMKIGLEVLRRRVKEQGIISQSDEKRTV